MRFEIDPCPFCGEPVLPAEVAAGATRVVNGGRAAHVECLARSVIGSLGHQQGRCPCFGGSEDDPPGLSRREAARAAYDYYWARRGGWVN